MNTLSKILKLILALVGIGGLICAVILAISAKAWFPLVAIAVLGWLATPTIKSLVDEIVK